MLENQIEQHLRKRIESRGGMCIKLPAVHTIGIPDRMCILPHGRIFFAELKRPGALPRPIQVAMANKLLRLGVPSVYFDNKTDIDKYLEYNYGQK